MIILCLLLYIVSILVMCDVYFAFFNEKALRMIEGDDFDIDIKVFLLFLTFCPIVNTSACVILILLMFHSETIRENYFTKSIIGKNILKLIRK